MTDATTGAPPADARPADASATGTTDAGSLPTAAAPTGEPKAQPNMLQRILDWLRSGYPQGVPPQDYIPLIGILHRSLTEAEVAHVAEVLADAAGEHGQGITRDEIARVIEGKVYERASDSDIARVSSRLASAGWPLAFGAEITPAGASEPGAVATSAATRG